MPLPIFALAAGAAKRGIKQIIANNRLGNQAKASGFIQPSQATQQAAQQSSAVAQTQNRTLIIIGVVLGFFVLIFAFFKKK